MIKYTLPALLAAAVACGPKGEYQAPVNSSKSYEQIVGEDMVKAFSVITERGNCTKPLPGVVDCRVNLPMNDILVTRAVSYQNVLSLETVTQNSGKPGFFKTPSGKIKPAKIDTKYILYTQIEPPLLFCTKLEETLTIYEVDSLTQERTVAEVQHKVKCYKSKDGQKSEIPVTAEGLCVIE